LDDLEAHSTDMLGKAPLLNGLRSMERHSESNLLQPIAKHFPLQECLPRPNPRQIETALQHYFTPDLSLSPIGPGLRLQTIKPFKWEAVLLRMPRWRPQDSLFLQTLHMSPIQVRTRAMSGACCPLLLENHSLNRVQFPRLDYPHRAISASG